MHAAIQYIAIDLLCITRGCILPSTILVIVVDKFSEAVTEAAKWPFSLSHLTYSCFSFHITDIPITMLGDVLNFYLRCV